MLDPEVVGRIIQKRRSELELTQEQLGEKVGVTPQAVSKWEKGVSLPDTALLPGVSRVLNVPIDALLGIPKKKSDRRWEQSLVVSRNFLTEAFSVLPAVCGGFGLYTVLMAYILRGSSEVSFGVSVGSMAVIIVTWLLSWRARG